MTGARRDSVSRGRDRNGSWGVCCLIALAVLLFCWTHRHALSLGGFADDLGLLADLPQRAMQGSLLFDALSKWGAPLWPGSAMWRPWPYASFALDAALWGDAAGLWRISNLLIHCATAALVGLTTSRLLEGATKQSHVTKDGSRHGLAGAVAFSAFLLMPWGAEVSIWLVGRFDGWATLAVMLSIWGALRARGADGWFLLSVAAGAVACMSKESALILPVWLALIALTQRASAARNAKDSVTTAQSGHLPWLLVLAHMLLAVAVLIWRTQIVTGSSIAVYDQQPVSSIVTLASRFVSHLTFANGLVPLAPEAALVAGAIAVLLSIVAIVRSPGVAALGLMMSASVLLAIALYIDSPPGVAEGYRLYYLATPGLAMCVGTGLAAGLLSSFRRALFGFVGVLVAALAVWQSHVVSEWTQASRYLDHAARATERTISTLPVSEYGLLLLPDAIGHVPLMRNAQGVLLRTESGGKRMLDSLVIFTPPQFAEWQRLMQESIVPKLTSRADAPTRPTRYFCHSMARDTLVDLGYWPADATDNWAKRWRSEAAAACAV